MMIFLSSLTLIAILVIVVFMTYAHLRIFNRPYFGREFSAQPAVVSALIPTHIFVKHLEGRHWWELWLGSWLVRLFCKESPELRERKVYAKLYLPNQNFSQPFPLVVYTHGNGAVIEEAMAWLEHLNQAGFAILMCEYRGYGDAGAHPERSKIKKDLCFFYDETIKTGLIDTSNITFYGRSLGGGVSCDLSFERSAQKLILESTFYKLREITGINHVPDFILTGKDFECAEAVKNFKGDVFICHGINDVTSPVAQAHKLMALKPTATLKLFDANHGDIYQKQQYKDAILEFLNKKK